MLLKTRGPQAAGDLGAALGITAEATRQQLFKLAVDRLVAAVPQPSGVGRPVQIWGLTPQGQALFPDTHAELVAQLIGAIRSELGEDVLDRLIAARAAESLSSYTTALEGITDLGKRVERLALARTKEGYMAECQPQGDGYLLVENHCPICTAARTCQGFCQSEGEVFRKALGRDVSVERTEHIVAGDRRCAYRISLKSVPSARPAARTKEKRS
jgi:predicted ArsR family transcriptional regulator